MYNISIGWNSTAIKKHGVLDLNVSFSINIMYRSLNRELRILCLYVQYVILRKQIHMIFLKGAVCRM